MPSADGSAWPSDTEKTVESENVRPEGFVGQLVPFCYAV